MHALPSIQSERHPPCDRCTDTASWEGPFATVPITPVPALLQQPDEEELYLSFEQAISVRVLMASRRPSRLSGLLHSPLKQSVPTTEPLQEEAAVSVHLPPSQVREELCCSGSLSWWEAGWLGRIRLVGLALLLMLVGFDVMGLLVLYAR